MTPPFFKQRFLVRFFISATALAGFQLQGQTSATEPAWPSFFKLNRPAVIKLTQQGGDGKPFIYRTKSFELSSPTKLSEINLRKFATTAESVPAVLARIPLPLLGMPTDKAGKPTIAKVLIYPDEESFVEAGGASGAAGYYSGKKQAIMLRADTFLNPPPTAGSKLPPRADYDLLVHEFTHLCMHRDLAYLPVWFTEGSAEYIAATHENRGVYQFTNIPSLISRRIKKNLPRDRDHVILPGLAETMALDHNSWRRQIEHGAAEDGYRMYATSLLLTHSLFHGGQKRRSATKQFLENIQHRKPLKNELQILIPTADRQSLQQKIVEYWKTRGLRIKFRPTPAGP